ncbi:MAG: phosphoenolpyruvate--protein phosphotransferase [Lachnospiraceae bacterium]|nr:phosphoenolpyruvate--protein phosphotransferase [Lachnospiraceae bacterium]
MEKVTGQKILNGIAIGKILYYVKAQGNAEKRTISDTEAEVARFEAAKETAQEQLQVIYEKALAEQGEETAQLFEVHSMLLDDDDYKDAILSKINDDKVNAEYAVAATGEEFAEMFASMEDEYFQARSADIKDISTRVVNVLSGVQDMSDLAEPCILVAVDLAPSETVQMDTSKLLAFVTKEGSTSSHTAILARNMGIPALIKTPIDESWNGKLGIVDGAAQTLIIDPDEATLADYQEKQKKEQAEKALLQELKGKESVTKAGRHVKLFANIGSVADMEVAKRNDAEGIGLFRSEFLYLNSSDFPTEEEQFKAYKAVAEGMEGKQVVIRTLDLGADKQVDYFNLGNEANPALGYRAIRICLEQPEIFRTQLRALLRASAYGNIAIMYPMITSVEEVRDIKEIVAEVMAELDGEGIAYNKDIKQGIMIETPASVLISDLLAKEVDFFSMGTNDLTQYTLAVDRQNNKLDRFYKPHHEAIKRAIKMVCDNAHAAGIWAGICGELGADPEMTEFFLTSGVDELSVASGMILPLRKKIRESEIG